LLWLASNSGGDPPRRIPTTPPGDATTGKDTGDVPPTDVVPDAPRLDISEPAAAEGARVKAAERAPNIITFAIVSVVAAARVIIPATSCLP